MNKRGISLLKKIKYFLKYRNVILDNEDILLKKFNIRIDQIYRLYTVYSISPEDLKKYGDMYLVESSKTYLSTLNKFLIKNDLLELFETEDSFIEDELNMVISIKYSLFDTLKIANRLRNITIVLLICLSIFGTIKLFL